MKQSIGFVGLGPMRGRGEWDTSDIISFHDELANI